MGRDVGGCLTLLEGGFEIRLSFICGGGIVKLPDDLMGEGFFQIHGVGNFRFGDISGK